MKPENNLTAEYICLLWIKSKAGTTIHNSMMHREIVEFGEKLGKLYSIGTYDRKARLLRNTKPYISKHGKPFGLLGINGIRIEEVPAPGKKEIYWFVRKINPLENFAEKRDVHNISESASKCVKRAVKHDLEQIRDTIELVESKCNLEGQFEVDL